MCLANVPVSLGVYACVSMLVFARMHIDVLYA